MSSNQDRSFGNNAGDDFNSFGDAGAGEYNGGVLSPDMNGNKGPIGNSQGNTNATGANVQSGGGGYFGGVDQQDNTTSVPSYGNNNDTTSVPSYGNSDNTTSVPSYGNNNSTNSASSYDNDQGNSSNTSGSTGTGGFGSTTNDISTDNQRATGAGGTDDSFDRSGGQDSGRDNNTNTSGPTMGDKLKGGFEKMAGHISRNKDMVQRGEDRTATDTTDGSSTNY